MTERTNRCFRLESDLPRENTSRSCCDERIKDRPMKFTPPPRKLGDKRRYRLSDLSLSDALAKSARAFIDSIHFKISGFGSPIAFYKNPSYFKECERFNIRREKGRFVYSVLSLCVAILILNVTTGFAQTTPTPAHECVSIQNNTVTNNCTHQVSYRMAFTGNFGCTATITTSNSGNSLSFENNQLPANLCASYAIYIRTDDVTAPTSSSLARQLSTGYDECPELTDSDCGASGLTVTNPQLLIQVTPTGTLTIDEGDSTGGTLQVKLSRAPTANVTVTLAKTNTDVTLDPASLTFTSSNWSTAQSVTVKATDDSDTTDETDTITFSASGGITASNATTKAVSITDDDSTSTPTGTIQVTPTGTLTIDEGDSTGGTLSVSLSATTAPTANVTVSLAKTNADVTLSPTSLTFTASNYSQAQTVTVTAAEDSDTSHETDTITLSASGGITAPNVTKAVSIVDDEGPGLDITPASLTLTEGGQATFQVRLKTQPSAITAISFTIQRLNQASNTLTLDTEPNTAGNQRQTFFEPTGQTNLWNQYQTITVSAGQDGDMNDESFSILIVGSNATEYRGNLETFAVTVTDDDKPTPTGTIQVTPAGTLTIDEGDSTGGTLSVSLSRAPNANVTVSLAKTNSDVTLSPTSLTFTASNWSQTQTVTVTAAEDNDTTHETDTITFSATGGITAPNVTKSVSITDDDKPAGTIQVTPAGTLNVDEGDSTGGTLSVTLSARPNADVTVALAKTNQYVTLSPTSLTFTSGNYSNTQTVTVTAAEDDDADDDTDTITFSATGGITASNVTKAISIDDDEPTPGAIQVSPAGTLNIDEGSSGELKVKLNQR
eukprot:XP_019858390.1 PREDICTED: uncharacterized protein PB18E9.04c-like [Amphimedon queenslandica]